MKNLLCGMSILPLVFGAATHAQAQSKPAAEDGTTSAANTEAASDIIVTGTRQARSASDTVAPVDVISGEELVRQGDSDLSNLIRTSVPSYQVNSQVNSDGSSLIRPANLRGLSPDNSLVLVNGKRIQKGAVVTFLGGGVSDGAQGQDISVIPALALKRVEVLRDGASSQYGSDAIAGVMNFILNDSDHGFTASAKWGSTYKGDGDQLELAANAGFKLLNGGFLNLTAEWSQSDATDRSVQRTDAAALIAAGNTAVANPAQTWGQPRTRDNIKTYVNASVPLGDDHQLYFFGNYAERKISDVGFFFRNPTNRGGVYAGPMVDPVTGFASSAPNAVRSILVGNLNPNNASACPIAGIPLTAGGGLRPNPTVLAAVNANTSCFSWIQRFPGGFQPRFGADLKDYSVAAGIKGELLGGLKYDLSYRYGVNQADPNIRNTINSSMGPNSPTQFQLGSYKQTENLFNLDLGYNIDLGNKSSLFIAAGGEYHKERFAIGAGDPASYTPGVFATITPAYPTGQSFSTTSNGFAGFSDRFAGSHGQNTKAAYVEVDLDLHDKLTVQGAFRHGDTAYGPSDTWKLGALYKIADAFRVRATYSTGFHVPSAGQANVTNVGTVFSGGQLQDVGTFPLNSAPGQIVSNYLAAPVTSGGLGQPRPTLGSEDAKSFTAGIAGEVGPVSVTLDYFNIKLNNRLGLSSDVDFVNALRFFANQKGVSCPGCNTSQLLTTLSNAGSINRGDFAGFDNVTSFNFFTNQFDTRTQGVDFVANARLNLTDAGTTRLTLAANYTETRVTRAGSNISGSRVGELENNLPKWKGFLNISHEENRFHGLARVNYYGGFDDDSLSAPQHMGSRITVDAEIGYDVLDNFEITAGAQNLFNTYPTEYTGGNLFGAKYTVASPFGFNGGSYYIKARYRF